MTTDDIAARLRVRGVAVDHEVNSVNFPLVSQKTGKIEVGIISVGPTNMAEWPVLLRESGLEIPEPEHAVWFVNEYAEKKRMIASFFAFRLARFLVDEPFVVFPHKPIKAGYPYSTDWVACELVLCMGLFPSEHSVFLRSVCGGFTGFLIAGIVPGTNPKRPRGRRPY